MEKLTATERTVLRLVVGCPGALSYRLLSPEAMTAERRLLDLHAVHHGQDQYVWPTAEGIALLAHSERAGVAS